MSIEALSAWLESLFEQFPHIPTILKGVAVALLALIAYLVAYHVTVHVLGKIVSKTSTHYDDVILNKLKPQRIAYIAALIILYALAFVWPAAAPIINPAVTISIIVLGVLVVGHILDTVVEIYRERDEFEGIPIKGYVEIVKIFFYLVGLILIISLLSGKSPWLLLSGLGAVSAVLLLIFRDTILSLVASFQITSNDLVRVGDWIEVPTFKADGNVIDVALYTIQIQNWDKTTSVIPTHKLLEVSFKNWRGMTDSGGRRIKRALYIDVNSIRLCDQEMIQRFEKIQLIGDYVQQRQAEIEAYNRERKIDSSQPVNGRHMTNVGTFRIYMEAYIANHSDISQEMTLMVRQLAPTPQGLPIEVYAFSSDTNWINYEKIQADLFDHFLAVASEFDLRVFQEPIDEQINIIVEKTLTEFAD